MRKSERRTQPSTYWRTLRGLIFLLLLGGFVAAVLAEGLLRVFPGLLPPQTGQFMQAGPEKRGIGHPYIGHLHKPYSTGILWADDLRAVHHTDGYGFRNAWPWPGEAEIVAVGDSLTFGYGVEDDQSWPAILDRALPRSGVINLGLIGAGPPQYLRLYETFGMKLRPRVVIVGLFVRNDFWDAGLFDRWLDSGTDNYMVWRDFGRPKKVGFSPQEPLFTLLGSLLWKSRLLAGRSYLYNLLAHVREVGRREILSRPKFFHFTDGARLHLQPADFVEKTLGARPDRREFRVVIQALQRIQSLAKEQSAQILIILQPSKEEVYLPLLGEDAFDPALPLRGALKKLDIGYLDLTPAFRRRAAAGEKLFFEVDGHPNVLGYALIADVVLSHLRDNADRYGLQDWQ